MEKDYIANDEEGSVLATRGGWQATLQYWVHIKTIHSITTYLLINTNVPFPFIYVIHAPKRLTIMEMCQFGDLKTFKLIW